jgi:CheY-like chemotaxis protein
MPKRIGEILREAGVLDAEQLEEALRTQRRNGGRLASTLLGLGTLDERALAMHLSRQQGVPFVVLSASAIPLSLLEGFPRELAVKADALPVFRDGQELFVALADPRKAKVVDELRFLTGLTIVEHGALLGPLQEAIGQAYRMLDMGSIKMWQGMDVDPSVRPGLQGHLAIALGSSSPIPTPGPMPAARSSVPPSPATKAHPAATSLNLDWVTDLAGGGISAAPPPAGPPPASPRAATQPPPEPAAPAALAAGPRASVLVVDDEPDIRFLLAEVLRKAGYQVQEAEDGNAAVALLRAGLPDALVLDAMLPGIHGFDLCKRLKSSPATRHIKVIMVSAVYRGWRYADDVRRLYGADDFLEKPLRLEELKRALERALASREAVQSQAELTAQARQALEAAALAYRQGDVAGAVAQLQQAIAAAPFAATLHHRLGLLYDQVGEVYRALAALDRAAELEPSLAHVLDLARLYEKAGFTHKAFEAWERALRLSQDPAQQAGIKAAMARLLP